MNGALPARAGSAPSFFLIGLHVSPRPFSFGAIARAGTLPPAAALFVALARIEADRALLHLWDHAGGQRAALAEGLGHFHLLAHAHAGHHLHHAAHLRELLDQATDLLRLNAGA